VILLRQLSWWQHLPRVLSLRVRVATENFVLVTVYLWHTLSQLVSIRGVWGFSSRAHYTSTILFFLMASFPQFLLIQFFIHHREELYSYQIHFLQLQVHIHHKHWLTQDFPFYIESSKFDYYSISVSEVVRLSNSPFLKNKFFRTRSNILSNDY
jgi:hypothetical protein